MSDSEKSNSTSLLLIIFLTVFLVMLGVTIIIPVVPAIFEGDTAVFANQFSKQTNSIIYGLLIASYPFMQFFGAPILGKYSDRVGRKPVLLMSMTGALIGYLLFGLALQYGLLFLIFISRMIPGFMAGNIAVILSSISDLSDEESKAKNFGLVGAAFGLGFVIGPSIGGLLADSSVVSWFSLATPFWFTAILTVCNMILVYFYFPETNTKKVQNEISLFQGFKNVKKIFEIPNLRGILTVVMLVSFGFSFFTQFFAIYLYREFDFSVRDVGMLFGWVGIWLFITQAGVIRIITKKFKPEQILKVTPLMIGIFVLLLLVPDEKWMFYLIQPMIAISYGLTNPTMTALVSKQVSAEQQGEVLGINQSMSSLGQIIPPLVGGFLAGFDAAYPLIASFVMLVGAWLVFLFYYGKK